MLYLIDNILGNISYPKVGVSLSYRYLYLDNIFRYLIIVWTIVIATCRDCGSANWINY